MAGSTLVLDFVFRALNFELWFFSLEIGQLLSLEKIHGTKLKVQTPKLISSLNAEARIVPGGLQMNLFNLIDARPLRSGS